MITPTTAEIPYQLIGELMKKVSVKQWIATYEKTIRNNFLSVVVGDNTNNGGKIVIQLNKNYFEFSKI